MSERLERQLHDEPHSADNESMKFSAAVAMFGMLLRDSELKGDATFDKAIELAREGRGDVPHGDRAEFVRLVETAKNLS